jgi:alkanesulfonate monooxygenase SsuD/methylene tetrahydromethanopterin reductase-like flavin-dependent oxidoreductase (luciferase family)
LAKSGAYLRNIPADQLRQRALVGTPDAIRKRLVEVEQAGVQELIVFMQDSAQLEAVRMFAHECMQR